jgi:hypothetical protein
MSTETNRIIVTQDPNSPTTQVHHRDFAEIRAEGSSVKEAASLLSNKLARALDSALTDWRRQVIEQAIADVKAFVSAAPKS